MCPEHCYKFVLKINIYMSAISVQNILVLHTVHSRHVYPFIQFSVFKWELGLNSKYTKIGHGPRHEHSIYLHANRISHGCRIGQ